MTEKRRSDGSVTTSSTLNSDNICQEVEERYSLTKAVAGFNMTFFILSQEKQDSHQISDHLYPSHQTQQEMFG